MNNKMTRSYATLSVYSRTLSAQELIELIPVQPDRSWQKGTPNTRQGRDPRHVHRLSGLSFRSRLDRSADPNAHLDDLLHLISTGKDALREFAERARVEDPETKTPLYVRLVVETTRGEIGFDFSDELLKAISDLGAHLGVELEFDDE